MTYQNSTYAIQLKMNGIRLESPKMSARKNSHKAKASTSVPLSEKHKELRVTAHQLVDYMNEMNASAKCSFCGVGEYGVPSDPTGATASIVATPVPHVKGIGLWLYTAVCGNCAHVIFFHAPGVSTKLLKD